MKDVMISVKGQSGLGGEGRIELVTEGRFYQENGAYCISYKESGMTGMEGTTTTLKAEKGIVSLIRTGTVSSTFIFEVGKKNTSHYATEYGVFTIGVQALEVNVDINDKGGDVSIVYSLDIFGRDAERNEFIMSVREV
ncbi:MAG: DUF1934 domain-containing protein [Clostridia bacterium]